MRGGTSKGIFINKAVLPTERELWDPIFLGLMGSPDSYGRQLNGMGGGISSLSKICIVGQPTPQQASEGIQVEYTFVQVGIRDSCIDYSGNCGNLSSVIGVFAVDEGICKLTSLTPNGRAKVRSFNTNTQKIIDTTFPIDAGVADLDLTEVEIAGVPGQASEIILDFVNPAGARTGKLLPTGHPKELIDIPGLNHTVQVSCVDATNPTIFVRQADLDAHFPIKDYLRQESDLAEHLVGPVLESLRQTCAQRMALDPNAQAQPKIALLSSPSHDDLKAGVDIVIHALSMGVVHKAVPMTVGLCLGVASRIPSTIAWDIVQQARSTSVNGNRVDRTRIKHPGGHVDVGADFDANGSVLSAKVIRTGRRLMKGMAWW
ncbi:hypothetical protein ONZ45_g7598 [Pleurotus djamor]|nr:hypothetical protein ONZ45_g7598 [Pleurotus djamor]